MNRTNKLIKNSGIFFIGQATSKILLFFLVSVLSYNLSVANYGRYELILQVINLSLPFVMLGISESVLRFTLSIDFSNEKILSNSYIIIIIGCFCYAIIMLILAKTIDKVNFAAYIVIIVFLHAHQSVLQQFSKGLQKNPQYIISSILEAGIELITVWIYSIYFKEKLVSGCFIAIIIGYAISNIYLILTLRTWKLFRFSAIDKNVIRCILIYSLPLMPNSLLWWITGSSDRFILSHYCSMSDVGLYSVAAKIPSLLTTISYVVFQALQISAVEEYNSEDKEVYFSSIFNTCSSLLFISCYIITFAIKPLMKLLLAPSYQASWQYVPILLLGSVFSSLQSFIGTTYMASKKTVGALLSTMLGSLVNIVLNFLFIPKYGIWAATITTMMSYIIVLVYRKRDTQKYLKLSINKAPIIGNILNIILVFYSIMSNSLFLKICSIIFLIIINSNEIRKLITIFSHN